MKIAGRIIVILALCAMLATAGMALAEDRNMVCSCWLTAYDYGEQGMGSETAEYRSGYQWCDNNGYWSGKAWINGWDAGYGNRQGGIHVPRDCEYFFSTNNF